MASITIKEIGKSFTNNTGSKQQSKFFWVNPETVEISKMFDTRESAREDAARVLKTLDKTNETILICEVVEGLQATRTIATENFVSPKRK